MINLSEIAERLKSLTPSLKCTKMYDRDWVLDRGQPTMFICFLEQEIYIHARETEDKTDEEVRKLIFDKMCDRLKDALKELGE